ncbi:hypothetical protein PBAL39_17774 [Pedobacter sp. BAL39]|nr:hypothetical protein PBAL39_17774 [Pedobacter sp. BAL39]
MIVLCGEKNLICFADVQIFVLRAEDLGLKGIPIFFSTETFERALKRKRSPLLANWFSVFTFSLP